MQIWTAFRAFFRVLFHREFCLAAKALLDSTEERPPESAARLPAGAVAKPAVSEKPTRSDAITLLAALQREARFVDLVQESLDNYSDAQVGAAARDVLRDCSEVIHRFFDLRPAVDQHEGSTIDVPRGFDAGQYQLKGSVTGDPPYQGKLVHHGWLAAKAELPRWSGKSSSQMIVAPIQVEMTD